MYYRFIRVVLVLLCLFTHLEIYAGWGWLADLIPPYNRDRGRDGCLASKWDRPGDVEFCQRMCAEPVQNINFFNPQVTVRVQDCNAVWCMAFTETLNGDGECMMRPGPLIMPLVRICARIAVPQDIQNPAEPATTSPNTPQDPGYTPSIALFNGVAPIPASSVPPNVPLPGPVSNLSSGQSYSGVTLLDPLIIGEDGSPIASQHPKLCTYYDPWMLELIMVDPATIPFFDPMDYNPVKQPFQTGSGVSPIAKAIIDFVEAGETLASDTIIGGPFGPLAGAAVRTGAAAAGGTFNSIISFVPKCIDFLGKHTFIAMLKYFGQFNKIVYESLGCVNLSLGPFPPPYNPKITVPSPSGIVESVCVNNSTVNGAQVTHHPTIDNPCAISVLRNNAIHNTVRVGFHTLLPLCLPATTTAAAQTPEHDNCCTITTSGTLAASSIHGLLTNDTIPNCNNSLNQNICVNTPSTITASQFRVQYGMQYGEIIANDFYDASHSAATDCVGNMNVICQLVLGVDVGNFVDIPVIFPAIEISNDTTTIQSANGLVNNNISSGAPNQHITDNVGGHFAYYSKDPALSVATISDPAGALRTFYANITRTNSGGQDPSMVCVYEQTGGSPNVQFDNVVGCISRAATPTPSVYDCSNSPTNLITCNNADIFAPQFLVQLKSSDGFDSTIAPLSVQSVNTNPGMQTINLAGFDYNAFVTDNENHQMPFSGSHAFGAASRFGNYLPYTITGSALSDPAPVPPVTPAPSTTNPNPLPTGAIYLNGLEYQNNSYSKGGDYICVSNNDSQMTPCSIETPQNCVLTKLLSVNTVQCSKFIKTLHNYSSLTPCTLPVPNTYSIDSTLPAMCSDFQNSTGCNDTLNFYKYTNPTTQNISYCYALNSGNPLTFDKGSTQLCQITYDPVNRLIPSYNPSIVNENIVDCKSFAEVQSNDSNITACPNALPNPCSGATLQYGLPAFCSDFSTTTGCTDTLNVYQCNASGSTSYCYALNSGNEIPYIQNTNTLCQKATTSYQAALLPNNGGPNVSYYDLAGKTSSSSNAQRESDQSITNNDIEQCGLYLSNVYDTPYTNIQGCSTIQQGCPLIEYYVSTSTNTNVNILGCIVPPANPTLANPNPVSTTNYCYTYTINGSSPGSQICQISQSTTTRYSSNNQIIPPNPNAPKPPTPLGPNPSPSPNQGPLYDADTQGLRNKTPVEMGLCVNTPALPTCAAIAPATSDSGYAIWPETTAGQQATGQCPPGYTQNPGTPLTRYCILDQTQLTNTGATSITADFEPLNGKVYCQSHFIRVLDQSNNILAVLSSDNTEATINSTNGPFSIQNPFLCSASNITISNTNNTDNFGVNLSYSYGQTWGGGSTSSVGFSMPPISTNAMPTSIKFTQYPNNGEWTVSVNDMICGPGMVLQDMNGNMIYRFISNEQFSFTPSQGVFYGFYQLVIPEGSCTLSQVTITTNGPGIVDIGGYPYPGDSTGGSWSWYGNAWSNGLPVTIILPVNVQATIQIEGSCN